MTSTYFHRKLQRLRKRQRPITLNHGEIMSTSIPEITELRHALRELAILHRRLLYIIGQLERQRRDASFGPLTGEQNTEVTQ